MDEELKKRLEAVSVSDKGREESLNIDAEELRTKKIANDDAEDAKNHRNKLVCWMMWVVCLWLLFTIVIVSIALGVSGLSDTVLCALLTTTTANVLGLAVIVLKGLFPAK